VTEPNWISLDGAANVRDVGGLPTTDGRVVKQRRLIRADNLQDLSAVDVRRLRDEIGIRAVADLRDDSEVEATGPGPLTREPLIRIEHPSLLPAARKRTDVVASEADAPRRLPWNSPDRRTTPVDTYLRYLAERPDSVVASLRLIATTDGATVVHCAAGKDRTGVVVAVALDEIGVERSAIVADYIRTTDRIDAILTRLAATPVYAAYLAGQTADAQAALPQTMEVFLAELDARFGGAAGWLRAHGWHDEDHDALHRQLVSKCIAGGREADIKKPGAGALRICTGHLYEVASR
jgi:protein tyrosine/serine phosphatase